MSFDYDDDADVVDQAVWSGMGDEVDEWLADAVATPLPPSARDLAREAHERDEQDRVVKLLQEVEPVFAAVMDSTPVKVKNHRRLHGGKRDAYARMVLSEVKAKFGVPANTPVNQLAVRRYAHGAMKAHGLRATDMEKLLPYVVAATFVPTEGDIAATLWERSDYAVDARRRYEGRGGGFLSRIMRHWCSPTYRC